MIKKPLSRRTFLYAGSSIIALPLLEAMLPFGKSAFAAEAKPLRYALVYWPHGVTQESEWQPSIVNGGLRLNSSGMLDPLAPFTSDISFLRNLFPDSWALHPGQVTTFATGGRAPTANFVHTCRTIDQVIADQFQGSGRIHSINMGSDELSGGEASVSGVYGSHISWSNQGTPATRYISNSQIFNLIVPGGGSTTTPPPGSTGPTEGEARQSVLDFAKDSLTRLKKKLGNADKALMDQYLTHLREVEKKIQETTTNPPPPNPNEPITLSPPMATCSQLNNKGACTDYPTDMDIKMDLMALAFLADRTRVMTHMFDPEPGYRNMSFIPGVTGQSHPNSHWRTNPDKLGPMVRKTVSFYMSKAARLLSRLKSMNEVGGTVLDNSLIVLGSPSMDGHNHEGINVPVIVAGKAGGALTPGQYIQHPSRTDISRFHLSCARALGVNVNSYSGTSSTIKIG